MVADDGDRGRAAEAEAGFHFAAEFNRQPFFVFGTDRVSCEEFRHLLHRVRVRRRELDEANTLHVVRRSIVCTVSHTHFVLGDCALEKGG